MKELYGKVKGSYSVMIDRLKTEERIQTFLEEFLKDEQFLKLEAAIEKKNCPMAFSAAHALKDVSQNLELGILSKSVEYITDLLHSMKIEEAVQFFPVVKQDYMIVTDLIRLALKKGSELDDPNKYGIYLQAIGSSYNYLIISNLSQNTFFCIINSDLMGWSYPKSGSYEDLIEGMIPRFPKEIQEEQRQLRGLQKQLEHYYSGEKYWEDKHPMYDASGNLHWLYERFMYTKDAKTGDILGVSVASIIDEEVRNERKSNQITHALSKDYTNVYLIRPRKNEISPVILKGYVTKGLNTSIGSVSDYKEMVHNYVYERVIEEDREQFLKHVSIEGIATALKDNDEFTCPYRINADGVVHDYQMKIIRTDDEETYIFAFKNIDMLMAEERLRRKKYEIALEDAKRANRAKSDFLSRMSHDIRTPINGIVGMTHMIKKQIDSKEKMLEGLGHIEQLTHQLELLINDVLEMSRIESGKIQLAHEPFDLCELLESFIPTIQIMADHREVTIKPNPYNITHRIVVSSPVHIQRILMNIISNAIKYNREGGSVCWKIREIPIDVLHSQYEFTIADTGIGMAKEFITHIFDPFAREEKCLETNYMGTGLGMAITKEFVDMLGGTIQIKSEQGVGTTVQFTLPLEHEIDPIDTTEKTPPKSFSLEGKRVLLVEDNALNLKIAKFVLEEQNMLVEVARNGQEAVNLFEKSEPNYYSMILMDIMMPIMNGFEATTTIRSLAHPDAKTIPILAMSANAFEEDRKKCLEVGMNEHIPKPLDIDNTIKMIIKLFGGG